MNRRQICLLLGIWIFCLIAPYAVALWMTPQGFHYGGLLYNPFDPNVHLAWMRQSADGQIFIQDLFTTEWLGGEQKSLFFNLFTFALGRLAGLGIPLLLIYHLARLLLAVWVLGSFARWCRLAVQDPTAQWLAPVLAAFSLGAGVLQSLWPTGLSSLIFFDRADQKFPLMAEAFTLSSALLYPLNLAAMGLLLAVWNGVLQSLTDPTRVKWQCGVVFVAALVLSNIHTYDAFPLILGLVLASIIVWRDAAFSLQQKRTFVQAACFACLGLLPPIAYQGWVFQNNSEFRLKALTPTPAPALFSLLLTFSLLLLPAAFALVRSREKMLRWIAMWPLSALLLIYLPVSFGRKMIEGVHLPLCLLAAVGISLCAAQLARPAVRRTSIAFYVLACCSSVPLLFIWLLSSAHDNNANSTRGMMPPLYLSAGDWGALHELNRIGQADNEMSKGRAVLCFPLVGTYVPRETSLPVFCGHWAETIDFQRKLAEESQFYGGKMSDSQAMTWLRTNHIGWVLQGQFEKRYFGAGLPTQSLGLRSLWSGDGTTLYQVP